MNWIEFVVCISDFALNHTRGHLSARIFLFYFAIKMYFVHRFWKCINLGSFLFISSTYISKEYVDLCLALITSDSSKGIIKSFYFHFFGSYPPPMFICVSLFYMCIFCSHFLYDLSFVRWLCFVFSFLSCSYHCILAYFAAILI